MEQKKEHKNQCSRGQITARKIDKNKSVKKAFEKGRMDSKMKKRSQETEEFRNFCFGQSQNPNNLLERHSSIALLIRCSHPCTLQKFKERMENEKVMTGHLLHGS